MASDAEFKVGRLLVAKLRTVRDDEAFDAWVDDFGATDVVSLEFESLQIAALGRMALGAVTEARAE